MAATAMQQAFEAFQLEQLAAQMKGNQALIDIQLATMATSLAAKRDDAYRGITPRIAHQWEGFQRAWQYKEQGND